MPQFLGWPLKKLIQSGEPSQRNILVKAESTNKFFSSVFSFFFFCLEIISAFSEFLCVFLHTVIYRTHMHTLNHWARNASLKIKPNNFSDLEVITDVCQSQELIWQESKMSSWKRKVWMVWKTALSNNAATVPIPVFSYSNDCIPIPHATWKW